VSARGDDSSAELAGPHPVNPLGDHDLGMLSIADIAEENSGGLSSAPPR